PDICLIAGAAGTGKSRVLAEIVYQLALRGARVLALSATAAATDRLLELVADAGPLCLIRCLEPGESTEQLPPASRRLTFPERLRQLREQPLQAARQDLKDLESRSQRLATYEPAYTALHALVMATQDIEHRLADFAQQQSQLSKLVAQACDEDGTLK